MIKPKYILLLLSVSLIGCKTLKNDHGFYRKYVSAFYDKKSKEPIIIYNKYQGKAIDTLNVLKREPAQCYYKFAFYKSKNGWVQIEKIRVQPCDFDEYKNNLYNKKWIKVKNLIITTSDCGLDTDCIKVNFYKYPNKSSKIVYSTSKYIKTNLIEVDGNWAKVIYQKGDEKIIGWLPRNRQCTFPWTNCIFNW